MGSKLPLCIAITLALTLCCTTTLYYFSIPDELQSGKIEKIGSDGKIEKIGVWGTPDSDFNWCEPNYEIHLMIAEPFNSLTSLAYIFVSFLGLGMHYQLKLETEFKFTMFLIAVIGVGSTLFHGTLRYEMQLLDEIPMHYLIVASSYTMFERGRKKKYGRWLPISLFFIEFAMTITLFFTSKTEHIHNITRGFMTCTFSIGFLYTLTTTAIINEEISKLTGKHSWLFMISFILWMVSIVCWITDIVICPQLHKLPFGLPYPQLHALGWHLGGASALYFTSVLVLLQRKLVIGKKASIFWYICLPTVKVIKNEKTKKTE